MYDQRICSFLKYGFIDRNNYIHAESVMIDKDIDANFLSVKISNFIESMKLDIETLDYSFSSSEDMTVKFSPSSSAIIVHEIFGHPFEDDYENSIIDSCDIKFPKFLSVFDKTFIEKTSLMKIDDANSLCERSNILVDNGEIKNKIKTKRKSRYDGTLLTRMTCLEISCNSEFKGVELFDFEVNELLGAFVDVNSKEVYLIPQEIYMCEKNKKVSLRESILVLSICNFIDDLCWVGNDYSIFQSFCLKKNSPIIVFAKTPSLIIKNIKVMRMEDIYK